jgi:hypothetical protein
VRIPPGKETPPKRKPYEKPVARQLTPEQAKLLLLGHVCMGHEEANDLLEILLRQQESTE